MPARNRVPSIQIASGTTNERDNSYNIPTVSIFFNTDTSNIELSGNVVAPMIDVSTSVSAATINATTSISAPSINATTGISAPSINATTSISAPSINATTITGVNSISFSDGSSPVKTTDPQNINGNKTFNNLVTMQGGLDFTSIAGNGWTYAKFFGSVNGGGSHTYVNQACRYVKLGKFFLVSVNYAPLGSALPRDTYSIEVGTPLLPMGYVWDESCSGITSGGQAIYTQGTRFISLRANGGRYTRGTFLLKMV